MTAVILHMPDKKNQTPFRLENTEDRCVSGAQA